MLHIYIRLFKIARHEQSQTRELTFKKNTPTSGRRPNTKQILFYLSNVSDTLHKT